MTLGQTTLRLMPLGITALNIMTPCALAIIIMPLDIMALSKMTLTYLQPV